MKKVYILKSILFNYVSFMLSRLFNPLSARHFRKNRIFALKKLSQTLNYHKIAVVELQQMSYDGIFCRRPSCPIKIVYIYRIFL